MKKEKKIEKKKNEKGKKRDWTKGVGGKETRQEWWDEGKEE